MGMSRDVSSTAVDKRSTVEFSVKISSLGEGRGALENFKLGMNEPSTLPFDASNEVKDCKTELESMVLSDSIVDAGIEIVDG